MKTENPEIKLLKEEISKREKIIEKIEKKTDRIRGKLYPLNHTKTSLTTIKKYDPSLDLRTVRSLLNTEIKKQTKRKELLEKDINKKKRICKWLDGAVRLAKEECGYKSIEKKELADLVRKFTSLRLEAGRYGMIEKFDHPKYPGMEFTESGFRYRKHWIFLMTENYIEMYYQVYDEPGEDDEEQIYYPSAKELNDVSPSMIEVLKKMDEILQKQ